MISYGKRLSFVISIALLVIFVLVFGIVRAEVQYRYSPENYPLAAWNEIEVELIQDNGKQWLKVKNVSNKTVCIDKNLILGFTRDFNPDFFEITADNPYGDFKVELTDYLNLQDPTDAFNMTVLRSRQSFLKRIDNLEYLDNLKLFDFDILCGRAQLYAMASGEFRASIYRKKIVKHPFQLTQCCYAPSESERTWYYEHALKSNLCDVKPILDRLIAPSYSAF